MNDNLSIDEITFDMIKNYNSGNKILINVENNEKAELIILFHNVDSDGDKGIVTLIHHERELKLYYFPSDIGSQKDYDLIFAEYESRMKSNPLLGICFLKYYEDGEYYNESRNIFLKTARKDEIGKIYTIYKKKDIDVEIYQYLILRYKDENGLIVEAVKIEKDENEQYNTLRGLKYVKYNQQWK